LASHPLLRANLLPIQLSGLAFGHLWLAFGQLLTMRWPSATNYVLAFAN
jgi:hypothetical protein